MGIVTLMVETLTKIKPIRVLKIDQNTGQNMQVYLQQIKKKAEAERKNCHAKTMLSLEKPIKLI
jgi:hypothetical protein